MTKLLAFLAAATFLMMMALIHYSAWADDSAVDDSAVVVSQDADFTDSGVGCTDDCIDNIEE